MLDESILNKAFALAHLLTLQQHALDKFMFYLDPSTLRLTIGLNGRTEL
jgi:hypothetical protein